MRTRTRVAWVFVVAVLSGCVPECGGLFPKCEQRCKETGECGRRTYKAGDAYARCFVRSSDDCASSKLCADQGRCHLYDGIEPGRCVALTDADCRASEQCKTEAKCSLGVRGECVIQPSGCQRTEGCERDGTCVYQTGGRCVKGELDCTFACRLEGACSLVDGFCVATEPTHCERSSDCRKAGQCTLAGDHCVAGSPAECEASSMCEMNGWCVPVSGGEGCYDGRTECGQLCWERGDCARIDGTCQPTDASACEASLACIVQGRCSVVGRPAVMCGAGDAGNCERSLECKAFGRCENKGIACAHDRGRSPSSVVGCLRDPECASEGRCLTADDGTCVTAAEAGLPDWSPPPLIP
ncbi:hypothetical protein [Enhygromyxa salina]|uniref:Uncharacterized protein n=1 Tax=Enhygromyxa salina TaxID=215803 RepID=A0A2S9YY14_9BACT|nr:hypothetical protein [Enhygromyxa salina]PRQ09962.1 hypothetical protein ENSA7_01680 [Enhygromyxa salina]